MVNCSILLVAFISPIGYGEVSNWVVLTVNLLCHGQENNRNLMVIHLYYYCYYIKIVLLFFIYTVMFCSHFYVRVLFDFFLMA